VLKSRVTHKFDISAVVKHQVLRLEVAVDDTLGVKIFERFNDARHTEPCCHIVKVAPATNQSINYLSGGDTSLNLPPLSFYCFPFSSFHSPLLVLPLFTSNKGVGGKPKLRDPNGSG